jgi:phage tail tube protein FII
MAYPKQIRNFNAFVDGVNYFGRATEGKLPDLKLMRSEEHTSELQSRRFDR